MRHIVAAIATAVTLLATSTPARGQSMEVSGLGAYTPSAGLESQAPELSAQKIAGGLTWGLQVGRLFTPRWGVELLWTQQRPALTIETSSGSGDLFSMTIDQLHGNVVYHLGAADARLRPFVFGGLGATFFRAHDLESETKFSFGLGAGVKYFRWNAIGIRAHVRYKPTMLNDEDSSFCDPFGFCQGTLQQVEFAAGGVIRF